MQTQNVSVVSIHPDPGRPLAWDFKDLLRALGGRAEDWLWSVRHLDWLGSGGERFCRSVESAGSLGLWLTSQELQETARGVFQTVEGEFLAFPVGTDLRTVGVEELSLEAFPCGRAELAIVAVDGAFFEVYAKDPDDLACFRRFPGVRDEDPAVYF